MLATGLHRLRCLGTYGQVESSQKYGEMDLQTTDGIYPHYGCTVPLKLAKMRAAFKKLITVGFGSPPRDVWHDCDGSFFAGAGENVEMEPPLLKASKKAHVVFYVSPVNVCMRDGRLDQQWVDDARYFGKLVRRSGWLKDIPNRRRKLCLVISKTEELRSPGLTGETLSELLPLLAKDNDLAEHYQAAFLIRSTTDRLREQALDRKGWETVVGDLTKVGGFLSELQCIGFGGDDLRITDDQATAPVRAFEAAVPLAWAAGFVNDKSLSAYPKCFSKLR